MSSNLACCKNTAACCYNTLKLKHFKNVSSTCTRANLHVKHAKSVLYSYIYNIKNVYDLKRQTADQEYNFTQKLVTTILSFKDLMAIYFYSVQRFIYKFYQFLGFDRFHVVSQDSSCQTLTNKWHYIGMGYLIPALSLWVVPPYSVYKVRGRNNKNFQQDRCPLRQKICQTFKFSVGQILLHTN